MKLILKQSREAGDRVCLCDENGEPLPNQTQVHLIGEPDDISKVHVTFNIGGDVELADKD